MVRLMFGNGLIALPRLAVASPDSVAEFHPAEPHLVGEATLRIIQSRPHGQEYCSVQEWLKAVGNKSLDAMVLLVREAVKHAHVVADFPVQLGHALGITEG